MSTLRLAAWTRRANDRWCGQDAGRPTGCAPDPIEEAFELVEHGVITEQDFRELTFVNPVRLHGGANPAFFDGSVCEAAARRALAEDA